MKKIISVLSVAVASISFEAHAAAVISEAYVDGVTVTTTGSAYFWFDGDSDNFLAEAVANFGTGYDVIDSNADILSVASYADSYPADFTTASAAAESTYLDAFSGPYSTATVYDAGNASGLTQTDMSFEVGGFGTVLIEFDVTVINEIVGSLGGEYAEASISVTDSFGSTDIFSMADGFNGDVYKQTSAILTLAFDVNGSNTGSVFVDTFAFADTAVNPVPVPAAAWLFASALLGLAGVSRRKA